MQHHKYQLREIDSLMPWEKEVYIDMLNNYLKEEEEKQKQQDRM